MASRVFNSFYQKSFSFITVVCKFTSSGFNFFKVLLLRFGREASNFRISQFNSVIYSSFLSLVTDALVLSECLYNAGDYFSRHVFPKSNFIRDKHEKFFDIFENIFWHLSQFLST